MFVRKVKYEATVNSLENEVESLEREVEVLTNALIYIKAQETPGANATVRRMSSIADEALIEVGVTEVDSGFTLADLKRALDWDNERVGA